MLFKLSNLNSNLALTLGYLNRALNNSALDVNYFGRGLNPRSNARQTRALEALN